MKKEDIIKIEIETPAIGTIVTKVPYEQNDDSNEFILKIPKREFFGTDYTLLDLSMVVENDLKMFNKLNSTNDADHQVHINTLTICGVKIDGNYIRVQYWFDQYLDDNCHRICEGVLTHHTPNGKLLSTRSMIERVIPEVYSKDVVVYW